MSASIPKQTFVNVQVKQYWGLFVTFRPFLEAANEKKQSKKVLELRRASRQATTGKNGCCQSPVFGENFCKIGHFLNPFLNKIRIWRKVWSIFILKSGFDNFVLKRSFVVVVIQKWLSSFVIVFLYATWRHNKHSVFIYFNLFNIRIPRFRDRKCNIKSI